MWIEDESGREKILIRTGIVWVGMIAVIETNWADNAYRLERILDYSNPRSNPINLNASLKSLPSAFRMLMIKGSFWHNDSKESFGLRILTN